jgi:hypothetical protein
MSGGLREAGFKGKIWAGGRRHFGGDPVPVFGPAVVDVSREHGAGRREGSAPEFLTGLTGLAVVPRDVL